MEVYRNGYPWEGMARVKLGTNEKGAPFVMFPDYQRGNPQWRMVDLSAYIEEGFTANAIIYSAIMYKGRSMSGVPLRAYKGDPDKPEKLPPDHPLSKLIQRPNKSQSWREYQWIQTVWLNLAGECYGVVIRTDSDRGVPSAVYPLNPLRVFIVPGKDGKKIGYLYIPEGKRKEDGVPILPQDMMHVKFPNPADPLGGDGYGLPPISPMARSGDVDNTVTKFLQIFFNHGSLVTGILTFDAPMDDDTISSVKRRWKEMYGGFENWDIGVLDQGGKYNRVGLTFTEMGFEVLDERNESRMLGPLGVPPILIGSRLGLMRSTYANYREARLAFWEDTAVPELSLFEDDYKYYLQSDDGGFVAFDYSDVSALKQDAEIKAKTHAEAFARGAITRAEYKAALGLSTEKEDNVYYVPIGVNVTPVGQELGLTAAPALPANSSVDMENSEEDDRQDDQGNKALAVRNPKEWLSELVLEKAVEELRLAREALERDGE